MVLSTIFVLLNFVNSSQSEPVIQLHQRSGKTTPATAIEAFCSLESTLSTSGEAIYRLKSRVLRDYTNNEWQTETNLENEFNVNEVQTLLTWIQDAQAGPFRQSVNPCDVGSFEVTTPTYPILISKDCGKRVQNLHPSASLILNWLQQSCSLKKPGDSRP